MATDFDDIRETPSLKATSILFTAGARIQINTPAAHAFQTITDFPTYSQWNHDTPSMHLQTPAPLQTGSTLQMKTIMVDQGKAYDIPVEILRLDAPGPDDVYGIAWRGMMMPRWFAVSERVQEVRSVPGEPGRCEVVTWESMAGWGAYPFKYVMGIPGQLKGFNRRYLESLKERAEKTAAS